VLYFSSHALAYQSLEELDKEFWEERERFNRQEEIELLRKQVRLLERLNENLEY